MARLIRLMPREWVADDVVEELTGGPLCLKCIATLRHCSVMNTIEPCRECGGHQALILHG